jgi:N-acetylglucosaminyl-diphospho-decaprenol L-rhamnosyltransferase
MKKTQPKASIIILDYKKSQGVLENVASIQKQKTDFSFEIIVTVNSADDLTKKKLEPLNQYANLRLILNQENLGYTRANNLAAQKAQGQYLLIVNPDILWPDKSILQELVDFMETNQNISIAAPKQVNKPGEDIAMTVRAFPKLRNQIARRTWLRKLPGFQKAVAYDEMRHLDYDKIQTVDWLQSSFWIVRKNVWNELGGLDESYFLFMSDPDFCWKNWQQGYRVVYFPKVIVQADGKRCSAGGFLDFFRRWTIRQHFKDAIKYHKKYAFKKNPRARIREQGS